MSARGAGRAFSRCIEPRGSAAARSHGESIDAFFYWHHERAPFARSIRDSGGEFLGDECAHDQHLCYRLARDARFLGNYTDEPRQHGRQTVSPLPQCRRIAAFVVETCSGSGPKIFVHFCFLSRSRILPGENPATTAAIVARLVARSRKETRALDAATGTIASEPQTLKIFDGSRP